MSSASTLEVHEMSDQMGWDVLVTDGVEGMCVDPREMEAILEAGGVGGPVCQEGERAGSWHQTVEEDRRYKMP